jgi:predicted RNA binding protein YcfA (HicA-like mRNA interferase family)
MGRLSGFRYPQIIKKLKVFGFEFFHNAAGSHEIWHNLANGRFTTIPNHPGGNARWYSTGNIKTGWN